MAIFQERIMQALEQFAQDTRRADDNANTIDGNQQDIKAIMTNPARRKTGKSAEEVNKLDEMLRHIVETSTKTEAAVEELQETMDHACRSSFRQAGKKGKRPMHKSLPWWTTQLTTQRKKVNTGQ
jgi:DNA anti-recombination protein RmuC